jgi:hypothetical protein
MDNSSDDQNGRISELFLEFSRKKLLGQYWPRLQSVVASLNDEQVWWRPNAASNSIGILLLHLNGNVRQWIVASFKQLNDERDRPAEFSAREGVGGAILIQRLTTTMKEAEDVLSRLTLNDLSVTYEIQGYTVTGLYAVYQVVEHFALHYGQIIYIAKMLTDKDLGFYKELQQTGHAPGGKNY